ncbi:MAG: DUF2202 domain-containing protein [Acidobacteria bacterium]|nr:DUF2202 domain-containing protein [Acidobacteriota bacterium]
MKSNLMWAAVVLMGAAAVTPVMAQRGTCGSCIPVASTPLTPEETKVLQFMREEEKMARDVYTALYEKWNLRIFDNIAKSEARHFEAVGSFLAAYGVEDPAANLPAGVYKNETLTALYAKLMEQGTASVEGALAAGVAIEKQDIADLESALVGTAKVDLKTMYTNLTAGSLSHLEAFETTLEILTATAN